MRSIYLLTPLFFLIMLLTNCEEEDKAHFGPTETDISFDTVYHAASDGLLMIDCWSNTIPWEVGRLYTGDYPDSLSFLGAFYDNDNTTYPIQKGIYWELRKRTPPASGTQTRIKVRWTPLY